MGAGRPTQGAEHVEKLEGEAEEKRRLRLILEVLAGSRGVGEACEELRISEARFHDLRRQALQAALQGLAPSKPGRPAKRKAEPSRVEQLEEQVRELRIELEAARVRTEIALVMPHLLKGRGKKNEPGKKR